MLLEAGAQNAIVYLKLPADEAQSYLNLAIESS